MKKIKTVGLLLLIAAMMYASNWDLPKSSWADEHQEELKAYEEARGKFYRVEIDGDIYEGAYIDGLWIEPAEIYQEVTEELMKGGNE